MDKEIKRSSYDGHILYKKICAYCQSEFWAKKINGKCCSNSCRTLKMMATRKSQIFCTQLLKN